MVLNENHNFTEMANYSARLEKGRNDCQNNECNVTTHKGDEHMSIGFMDSSRANILFKYTKTSIYYLNMRKLCDINQFISKLKNLF